VVLSAWVDGKWCYRRGLTECGIIGVGGRYVHGVVGVGGQCMVLSGVGGR